MNPFDLTGPSFLFFYFILSIVVILGFILYRNHCELKPNTPFPKLNDPYKIAFLRGGKNEALRVALLSLIDRTFLVVAADGEIKNPSHADAKFMTDPLELAVAAFYKSGHKVEEMYRSTSFDRVMRLFEQDLMQHELLPSAEQREDRDKALFFGLFVLVGVALTKMLVGLSRNKPVLLLVLFAVVAVVVLLFQWKKRRTTKGDAILEDLKMLLGGASRIENAGQGSNLAMTAAVFGMAAISPILFPHRDTLFRKAAQSGNSSCGSSCGSSCSSGSSSGSDSGSSGSSCSSSSCGGGGGCGGCGGGGD